MAVLSSSWTNCKKVRNAAARRICNSKTNQQTNKQNDHDQPILQSLHWLPIRARTQYNISTLCFSVITGGKPQYFSERIYLYTPCRGLGSSSAEPCILKIPRSSSKAFGQWSFSNVASSTWNHRQYSLRHSDSQTSFRQSFKNLLFQQSF